MLRDAVYQTYLLPLDFFPFIFFLFLLQYKFNEQLLKFFVAVVNTQLLKRIHLEDFETVDVEHSNDFVIFARLRINCRVYLLDNPCEQTVVDGLR